MVLVLGISSIDVLVTVKSSVQHVEGNVEVGHAIRECLQNILIRIANFFFKKKIFD